MRGARGGVALALLLAATVTGAATGRLVVRVVDESGAPATDARVTVTERATNRALDGATDRRGKAAFLGLAGGEVVVRVEREGSQIVERNARIDVGAIAEVEVRLAPLQRRLSTEELTPEQRATRQAVELFNTAVGQFRAGDDAAASRGVGEALRLDPAFVEAHLLQARLLSKRGDHAAAADSYLCAFEHDPQRADLLPGLIGELRRSGRAVEAAGYTAKLEALSPDTPQGLYDLALVKLDAGDDAAGLELLERVIERAPEHAAAYYQRGLIRLRAGTTPGAIEDMRRYLQLAPDGAFTPEAQAVVRALAGP